MPIKSKKQFKLIQSKRKQYKSESKAPKKWKWIFDKDFDPSKVDYDSLPEDKNTIEEYFNSFYDIGHSFFEEYRKDVENLNDTYIDLISNFNYPLKEVSFFNEGLSYANEFVLQKVLEVLSKDLKDTNEFLNKFSEAFGNKEELEKYKQSLINHIQKRYNVDFSGVLNVPDEDKYKDRERMKMSGPLFEADEKELKKILNNFEKEYDRVIKSSETEGARIKLIQNELNNLDPNDLKVLMDKYVRTPTQLQSITRNVNRIIKELNNSERNDKNVLLDIFKNKILGTINNIDITFQDSKEKEDEGGISPVEAFKILKDAKIFNVLFQIMKKKANEIDSGILLAEKRIGMYQAKMNPLGERGEQLILAKKLILAYFVIISSFTILTYILQSVKNNEEPIEEGLNSDIERILNKYYYSEIDGSKIISAPIKLFSVPTKFAFKITNRAILKKFTITSAKELTENPQKFIVSAKRYFLMIGQNSNQMQKVLNQYGIDFNIISKVQDDFNNSVIAQAGNKLMPMFNKASVSKTAYKLFQEYGIKQSFGAKLGEMAGKKVDSLKDSFSARKERMPEDDKNVKSAFSKSDDIDKNNMEKTNV